MTDEQPIVDDGILLDVASELTRVAQATGEPRVIQLMEQSYALLGPSSIATLMLRYGALKIREEELEQEIEQVQTTPLRQL